MMDKARLVLAIMIALLVLSGAVGCGWFGGLSDLGDILAQYAECVVMCDHQTTFLADNGEPVGLIEVRDRQLYLYGNIEVKAIDCEPVHYDDPDDWHRARVRAGTPLDWVAVNLETGEMNTPPWQ